MGKADGADRGAPSDDALVTPRILHVVPHLEANGNGVVTAFVTLAKAQRRSGRVVGVVSQPGNLVPELTECGVHVFRREARGLSEIRSIARAARELRADVIHAHGAGSALPVALAGELVRTPTLATAHSLFRAREYLTLITDRTVAVSRDNQRRLTRIATPLRRQVALIHNGVEQSTDLRPYDRARFNGPILFVGGLFRRKGVDVAITALALLRSSAVFRELLIAGEGPDRSRFEEQARALGIRDQVSFLGFRRDPRELLKRSSVLIVPSRDEPFGLVAAEAMTEGTPVIASAVGGLPEVLGEGRAGLLVPPDDGAQLAEVLKLILGNFDVARDLSARGLSESTYWSVDRLRSEYDSIYERALQRHEPN